VTRAMFALARVESVRLLRHPLTLVAVLLLTGPVLYGWFLGDGVPRYPVLHEPPRAVQLAFLFMLGGAALIAANLAVLRAHRHRTVQQFDVLVLPQRLRTGAHLMSLLPVALLGAVLATAYLITLALAPKAVGRLDPYEIAAVPVLVALMGAVGVLLGRLWRTVVLAPLVVVVCGAVLMTVAAVSTGPDAVVPYLTPVDLSSDSIQPVPLALMTWPSGLHLVYVTALVAALAVVTLALRDTRSARLLAAGAGALVLCAGAGAAQAASTSDGRRAAAAERQSSLQRCRTVERVTYCAFEEFAPWIGEWDAVVRGVLREVPPEVADRSLTVRQRAVLGGVKAAVGTGPGLPLDAWRAEDAAAGTPGAVSVGTRWGDGWSETGFAGRLAYALIAAAGPGAESAVCGGRGVVVTWLAGRATPLTRAGLATIDRASQGGINFPETDIGNGLLVPDAEVSLATALLSRPTGESGPLVRRHWAELTAEATTLTRAAELLGLPAPTVVDDGWSCR
jgi:hypothetical protein